MPGVIEYIPPNNPEREMDTNSVFGVSTKEMRNRRDAYNRLRAYYEGRQDKTFNADFVRPDDNITYNMVKISIDRMVTFLFPRMPRLEIEPHETRESPEERWLRECWQFNGGVTLLQDIAYNGAYGGHCFVRVMPPDESSRFGFPELINIDPNTISSFWRIDDIRKVLWYEVQWSWRTDDVYNIENRVDFLQDFVNMDDHWEIHLYRRQGGGKWDLVENVTWPWPIGPIISWKHHLNPNNYYGKQEVSDLTLQDATNNVMSEMSRIHRYYSSPVTVLTGAEGKDINKAPEHQLFSVLNDKAKIYNVEVKSSFELSQQLIHLLESSYLAQTSTVLLKGNLEDFQRVTNAGIRTFFMDMLAKNMVLRQNYGRGIQQISRIMGWMTHGQDNYEPRVIYYDPLPEDDVEQTQTLEVEREMQIVSRQTASEKRGYIWSDEEERMKKEGEEEIFQENPAQNQQNRMDDNDQVQE